MSILRTATIEDAIQISALLKIAFASYKHLYTEEAFNATTPGVEEVQERLAAGPCWVYETDTLIIGTLSGKIKPAGIYLYGMAVHPQFRNHKTAWRLLEMASAYARDQSVTCLYLSTTPFLNEAIRLYEKFGFVKTDLPPFDLYGTPLFTMEKTLTETQLI